MCIVRGMRAIRSGARDIDYLPLENGSHGTEIYWDIILLTESQLLLPVMNQNEVSSKKVFKRFQNQIVKRIGEFLSIIVRQSKYSKFDDRSWRTLGSRYHMIYLPLHFVDVIWCKSGSTYFHVFLPGEHQKVGDKKQANEKEWLLALLELASSFNLQFMRLYIRRHDLIGVSTFLRNLNWIGGKLVPNEDRNNYILNSPPQDSSPDNMLLGDEGYVILEFEC